MRSRCTCPNETASWNASANSARYAPNLDRVRNQFIVVKLHASRTRQNHSAGPVESLSNNVTLPQLGRVAVQSRDSSSLLQKNTSFADVFTACLVRGPRHRAVLNAANHE